MGNMCLLFYVSAGISLMAVHQWLLQLQTPIIIRMPCIPSWVVGKC